MIRFSVSWAILFLLHIVGLPYALSKTGVNTQRYVLSRQSSWWAPILWPKTSKTLFGPVNFKLYKNKFKNLIRTSKFKFSRAAYTLDYVNKKSLFKYRLKLLAFIATRTLAIFVTTRLIGLGVRITVFNATFNIILAILWQSVLLVEETRVPGENHWPGHIKKCKM